MPDFFTDPGGDASSGGRYPELLLVGEPSRSEGVQRALSKVRLTTRREPSFAVASSAVGADTCGAILVAPLAEQDLGEAVDVLRFSQDVHGSFAVFVVVPEETEAELARVLYARGALAVFEWPTEALLLPRMVVEILGTSADETPAEDVDTAIERTVNARLQLGEAIGGNVHAEVKDGVAEVLGSVDSLWKKQRVETMLLRVPGLLGVDMARVEVISPEHSDVELARLVRDVIMSASEGDTSTLSSSVRAGKVVLAGTVSNHDELERLVRIVANVRGVRMVENLVTVSATETRRARGLAEHLQRKVETLHPDADIRVAVFGEVAVLSGQVPLLATKRAVERHIGAESGVARVVNKLQVRH